jgi:hypothetical protein
MKMVPLYGPLRKISLIPTKFLFCHKAKFTRMKEHKEHSNKSFVAYKHNGELKEFLPFSPLLSSYVHFFLCICISQNSFASPFLFIVFFFHCCGPFFTSWTSYNTTPRFLQQRHIFFLLATMQLVLLLHVCCNDLPLAFFCAIVHLLYLIFFFHFIDLFLCM